MRRALLAVGVTVVGLGFTASAAYPACDISLTTRSKYLTFQTTETYPLRLAGDSLGSAELERVYSEMWDRLARGLATAVENHRRIERDPKLASLLEGGTLSIISVDSRIRPATGSSGAEMALRDSVIAQFRFFVGDSSAELYTVLLGSYLRGSAAESLVANVSVPDEEDEGERDTTVVLDIVYSDCFEMPSGRPRLFTLPPSLTANHQFWLLSGLFYSRDDATRAIARIRREWMIEGRIVKIRATGPVLRNAFARE